MIWFWVVAAIIFAVILIVISYKFRDAFFLFEGICCLCDAAGELGDSISDLTDLDD